MSKKRKLAYFLLLINTIVWGAAAPIVKPALSFITPEQFLFYRFLLASVISFPIVLILFRRSPLPFSDFAKVVLLELVGTTLILWLTYQSLKLTSAIDASVIYSTAPIFVTLSGIMFLRERETRIEWIGLGLALVGTVLVTAEPFIRSPLLIFSGSQLGNLLMLAQNIVWAGYLVVAKRFYRKRSKFLVTGISFWVGATSFFLLSLPDGNAFSTISSHLAIPSVSFAVLFMALFGSIIGATTYLVGQNLIEISEASIFTYLQPVVAVPLSVLWLKESLSPVTIMGMIVIGIGVYLSEFKRN